MIDLLNSILTDGKKIVDIRYDNKERTPAEADNRTVIYDIFCTTSDNRHIIVEMQYGRQTFFRERSIFYLTRSIEGSSEKGKWDYQFDEVLLIAFLKHDDWRISDKLRTDVMLKDIETNEVFSNRLRFIYLQMPLAESMKEADCVTDLDCWIYNLNNMEKLDELAFKDQKPIFNDLEQMATRRFMTWDENVAYQRSLKRLWDYDAVMDGERTYAREQGHKEGMAAGRAEGLAEGLAEGRAEGRAEGLAEGRAEGLKEGLKEGFERTAKNMLQKGFSIDEIADCTGLSKAEIENL